MGGGEVTSGDAGTVGGLERAGAGCREFDGGIPLILREGQEILNGEYVMSGFGLLLEWIWGVGELLPRLDQLLFNHVGVAL